jgi:hypothetical protein
LTRGTEGGTLGETPYPAKNNNLASTLLIGIILTQVHFSCQFQHLPNLGILSHGLRLLVRDLFFL